MVYKVTPGGEPLETEMGGFDVWGSCRLISVREGVLLLRHGPERFYIPAANVNTSTNVITTNRAHGLIDGDLVILRSDGELPLPLQPDTIYWVDQQSTTTLKLCSDSSLTEVDLMTAGTRFAIEKQLSAAQLVASGLKTNEAEPILLQGSDGVMLWDATWSSVPQAVSAIVLSGESVWTAGSHRFSSGDAVKLGSTWGAVSGSIATSTTVYVNARSRHTFTLHATQAAALLGTGAEVDDDDGDVTLNVLPSGYSGQPMVPLREAILYANRVVGLRAVADVAISDPGDFLHFTPFTGAKTAALGNGDPLVTLAAMGEDALVLPSRTQVLAVTGLSSSDSTDWRLQVVTTDYGFIAPLTVIAVGRDVWGLSRQGIMSVRATDFGKNQGRAEPVSLPIQTRINEIDWRYAHLACAARFNNKSLFAVPLKGQTGAVTNNCLLVFNHLTQAWDHFWQGTGLNPKQFSVLTVGAAERLCWIDADGSFKWFTEDGWEDVTLDFEDDEWDFGSTSIDSYIVTRGYTAGSLRPKRWHDVEITLAHHNPEFSISAITEGYNQVTTYRDGITKNPAKWLTFNQADFHSALDGDLAGLPYREDYSFFMTNDDDVEFVSGAYANKFLFAGITLTGFSVGTTYLYTAGNSNYLANVIGDPALPAVITAGRFVATRTQYELVASTALVGVTSTASVVLPGGVALDDGTGPPPDTHQTITERVSIGERGRILQLKLANAQGSTRWRSVVVAGTQERGDY